MSLPWDTLYQYGVADGTGRLVDLLKQLEAEIATTPSPATVTSEVVAVSNLVLGGGANGSFSMSHSAGATLLDYTTPTAPKVIAAGAYSAIMVYSTNAAFTGIAQVSLIVASNQSIHPLAEQTLLTATQPIISTLVVPFFPCSVNDTIVATGNISSGGGTTFTVASLIVTKIA